jgi:membrane-associated phospholipid phosphatase
VKRAKKWNHFADLGRAVLVGGAIAAPLIRRRDWRSSVNNLATLIAVSTAVNTIKPFWPERRPDGEDRQSFPSEHAADGFAAAVMFGSELKDGAGPVAAGLATAISLARVFSGKHHPVDVIAGAGFGIAVAQFAHRRD